MLHWLKKTGANCCCILVDLPVKHNSSLHFLVTALGRYSNNVSLVEKFEIMFNSQQQPIAIYAHLALPQWRADNFDIFQYFGFGHNTSVLGMASAVREGVVRPSSCDVRSPDWLTPNTFYSRGVLFNDDSFRFHLSTIHGVATFIS